MKKFIIFILVAIVCTSLIGFHKLKYNGIDVSHHNKVINWSKVATDKDVKFVYIKATEGKNYKDPMYKSNLINAKKHGLLVGSYHFFREEIPAYEQFENIKRTILKSEQDLIPVIDIEDCKESKKNVVDNFIELCNLVENYYGIKPIIYVNYLTYNKYLYNKVYDYLIWSSWKVPIIPNLFDHYSLVQFSESGKISGINTSVDLNYCSNINSIKYVR